MKKFVVLAAGLSVLAFVLAYAQPMSSFPNGSPPSGMPHANEMGHYAWVPETSSLPKFDLNFPGGTPEQLVKAIEKAMDKPLNVVIPDDCKDLQIPAFSVKNVTVVQVFEALGQASKENERYIILEPETQYTTVGSGVYSCVSGYGFRTDGVPTEDSVWYFYWDRGNADGGTARAPWKVVSSTVCDFFQLGPYLDAGYKVDDVTTVVETAWKMLGITDPPTLSYHKETKLLIAVGKQDQVDLVGDVLKQLSQGKPKEKSGK